MNLAAYYRPESFVGCEEDNPRLLPLSITVTTAYRDPRLRSFDTGSDVFGISTTKRLPGLRFPGESAIHVLDPVFSHFAALSDSLFIQNRRFIQPHGWWYSDILSKHHSSYVRHRVARGSLEEPTKVAGFFNARQHHPSLIFLSAVSILLHHAKHLYLFA